MLAARLTRKLLALTLAYGMVLGGVLGAARTHAFDAAAAGICRPLADAPLAPLAPDQRQASHECCQALCGTAAAILPPEFVPRVFVWSVVHTQAFAPARPGRKDRLLVLSARAPPLG